MQNLSKATLKKQLDFKESTAQELADIYWNISFRAAIEKWNEIRSKIRICNYDQTVILDRFWAIVLGG